MSGDSEADGGYLLGADDPELARLRRQDEIWRGPTRSLLAAAGFGPGMRLADLGCGPGWTTLELAALAGLGGEAIGRDRWERMILAARAAAAGQGVRNARFETADAAAPWPEASLDGAFARWLFCWLPDPAAALRATARGLRPGGRLAILDYLRYAPEVALTPSGPSFPRAIAAVESSWRAAGGDPRVGERLPALAESAGLRVAWRRELRLEAAPADPLWGWPTSFFPLFVPRLVAEGRLAPADADAFLGDWIAAAGLPDARFRAPPMLLLVLERPE